MEEPLQKDDIIRSPRGYLASVNWSDGEHVGVSFIEKNFGPLSCMTFKRDEVFVVKRGPKTFFKELFKKISDEVLREEIKQEREMRVVTPTQEQKVVRKRDNVKALLKDLSAGDQEALVEFIRMRKEKESETQNI